MPLNFALAGNPNCGKTTLFNHLTGSTAHVGNWPGVTVARKEGRYRKSGLDINIVDLPGIYSMSPYSPEEVVARNYIVAQKPDVVINIVDATNLERNLYLTTQIMECDAPVIVALNMMDIVAQNGDKMDIAGLEYALGVPVIPIAASQDKGLDDLMARAADRVRSPGASKTVLESTALGPEIKSIQSILTGAGVENALFYAVKLLEGDSDALKGLSLGGVQKELDLLCDAARRKCENGDVEAAVADLRYRFITENCSPLMVKSRSPEELSPSERIDRVVTNRFLGIPIFLFMMLLVFHLTFTENLFFVTGLPGPGTFLANIVEGMADAAIWAVREFMVSVSAADWLVGLVADGVLAGVGAVVGFLPLILVLYLFISILEDSGYMARAAFIMDKPLRKLGLTGKSFVPMIMGFGCSVPAISATRTLDKDKDRRLTIMLIPFMSCGAKMPIYALMVPIFFPRNTEFVVAGIYFLGIAVAIIAGVILNRTVFKGETASFVMELPPYRIPSLKSLGIHLWDKLKDFATRVGTVITTASAVIWALSNFGFGSDGFGMVTANSAGSILGIIGGMFRFVFAPLGFASGPEGWKAVVAVLSGLVAREAVVSTMGQLYTGLAADALVDGGASSALAGVIAASFSPAAALSFITWCLLSTPCMAAVGAMARELDSRKWFWSVTAFHLGTAWVVSFLVYRIAALVTGF